MGKILSLEDNAELVYKQATEKILKYTPQIFTLSSSNKITTHSSGIFVTDNKDFFLITAAHCIKKGNKTIDICILVNGLPESVRGPVIICNGLDKRVDIAIVKLQNEFVATCKNNYEFLSTNSFVSNAGIPDETIFVMVGYPVTKTFINHSEKKIASEPFVFLTKSKRRKIYENHNINKSQNIIVGYSIRKGSIMRDKGKSLGPNPYGVSGCGLWHIPSYFTENISPMLSGVMIEYDENKGIMLATKIEEVLKLLPSLERL